MKTAISSAAVAGLFALGGAANAQLIDYVSVSGGFSMQRDSSNDGTLETPFSSGTGTTVAPGTIFSSGSPVGFDTDFSRGYALSAAAGRNYGRLRGELELAYQSNGVDSHSGLVLSGLNIDNEDAGILFPGSPALGTAVGNVLNDDDGRIRTVFVMANAYLDVPLNFPVTPYVGAGIGAGFVNVDFSPNRTSIIDGSSVEFAWQIMAGASYPLFDQANVFAGYRYRQTTDAGVEGDLFDASFDVQNRAHIIEVGLRWAL